MASVDTPVSNTTNDSSPEMAFADMGLPVFLSVPAAIRILKWVYVGMHFAVLNPMLGRIAVGLYTLSLLGKNSRPTRYTIWFLMFQQIVHNVGIAGVLLHKCGIDPKIIAKYAFLIIVPIDDLDADTDISARPLLASGSHLGHVMPNSSVVKLHPASIHLTIPTNILQPGTPSQMALSLLRL